MMRLPTLPTRSTIPTHQPTNQALTDMTKANKVYIISPEDPAYIHDELVSRVGDIITDYRKDLLVHDLRAIAENPGRSFIHACYSSGTHIWPMAKITDDMNEVIPIVFGHGTRLNYHRQIADLITCNSLTLTGLTLTYYDSDTGIMSTVDRQTAAELYREATTRACAVTSEV